jgi:hypothetical protein
MIQRYSRASIAPSREPGMARLGHIAFPMPSSGKVHKEFTLALMIPPGVVISSAMREDR